MEWIAQSFLGMPGLCTTGPAGAEVPSRRSERLYGRHCPSPLYMRTMHGFTVSSQLRDYARDHAHVGDPSAGVGIAIPILIPRVATSIVAVLMARQNAAAPTYVGAASAS
jgi:hypothetical protein